MAFETELFSPFSEQGTPPAAGVTPPVPTVTPPITAKEEMHTPEKGTAAAEPVESKVEKQGVQSAAVPKAAETSFVKLAFSG